MDQNTDSFRLGAETVTVGSNVKLDIREKLRIKTFMIFLKLGIYSVLVAEQHWLCGEGVRAL